MTEITTTAAYKKAFPESVRKEALKYAYEVREFVDSGYWQRAAYFWALIAAAFTGYATLIVNEKLPSLSDQKTLLLLIISSFGLVLSVGWYMGNRGSKYWLVNWERHVDMLEDGETGPLYKTTYAHDSFDWSRLYDAYPFSVSKINCLISLYVALLWLVLWGYTYFVFSPAWTDIKYVLSSGTVVCIAALLIKCRVGSETMGAKVNFKQRKIVPNTHRN